MKRAILIAVLGTLVISLTLAVMVLSLNLRSTSSELAALRAQPFWTEAHEVALAVYAGDHRTHGAFKVLCRGPSTRSTIIERATGPDLVNGVIADLERFEIAHLVPGRLETYEVTSWGRRVCDAYYEIPEHLKIYAGCMNWKVLDCPAPPPRYTTTPAP